MILVFKGIIPLGLPRSDTDTTNIMAFMWRFYPYVLPSGWVTKKRRDRSSWRNGTGRMANTVVLAVTIPIPKGRGMVMAPYVFLWQVRPMTHTCEDKGRVIVDASYGRGK